MRNDQVRPPAPDVEALLHKMRLDAIDFSSILGVNSSSVYRWCSPSFKSGPHPKIDGLPGRLIHALEERWKPRGFDQAWQAGQRLRMTLRRAGPLPALVELLRLARYVD